MIAESVGYASDVLVVCLPGGVDVVVVRKRYGVCCCCPFESVVAGCLSSCQS